MKSSTATGRASSGLRLTRGIALAWVLVNAALPVFEALGWTALNKQVRRDDPSASWLPTVLVWLGVFGFLAPVLLQAFVLRWAAPALHRWQVVSALLASWMVALATVIATGDPHQGQADFLLGLHGLSEFRWEAFIGLPWVALAMRAGAFTAVCMLVPTWVFARAARVPLLAPLLAGVGASMVVALLWALWVLVGADPELLERSAMNGWRWDKRASALIAQASAQAIWAALTLSIFALVLRDQIRPAPGSQSESSTA